MSLSQDRLSMTAQRIFAPGRDTRTCTRAGRTSDAMWWRCFDIKSLGKSNGNCQGKRATKRDPRFTKFVVRHTQAVDKPKLPGWCPDVNPDVNSE